MTDQTPAPYGEPEPVSRDVWGPPTEGYGAPPATPGPWWSQPQQQPAPAPSPFSPAGGDTAVYPPAYPPAAGAPWGAPEVGPPAGQRHPGPLRVATVAALLAGLIGGGVGAGAVSLTRGSGGGSSSSGAPLTTLTQVKDSGPGASRPAGSVAEIAQRVLPSVVTIKEKNTTTSLQGTGSGVVIDKANGYILTNNHVVADAIGSGGSLSVTPDGGRAGQKLDATVVGADAASDIAVIKVASTDLPAITLGKSADVVVGDQVLAIGAPLGLSGTVTSGIVSALDRSQEIGNESGSGSSTLTGAIQTDAAINPGNSGGALVDSQGRLIGINTAIASNTGGGGGGQAGNIGIGFAIPVDVAAPIAQQLINNPDHTASHPYIGVTTKGSTDPVGARVVAGDAGSQAVRPGSPAAAAGLREGDVITRLGDTAVTDATELVAAVRKQRVGDTVALTVVRNGKEQKVSVTLADNPTVK